MTLIGIVAGSLATWRLTSLLHAEEGPFEVFSRLREAAADGFWGRLLGCFYCTSLWTAAPLALLVAGSIRELPVAWLALSGGAILVERLLPAAAAWREDPPAP